MWTPYSSRLAEVQWLQIFLYVNDIAVPPLEDCGDLFLILGAES